MVAATLTSKGQVTIPSQVRSELKLGQGDRIEFVKIADGRYEVVAATQDITSLRGMVKSSKQVSVGEMNRAIKSKAGK